MSNINNILAKIEKADKLNSVKLENHRVELALNDEIARQVKSNQDAYNNYLKAKNTIDKSVAAMKAAVTLILNNKDWGKKKAAEAQKYKAQLDKLSKELGVNLAGSEPDKALSTLFMIAEDGGGVITDAITAINSIGK